METVVGAVFLIANLIVLGLNIKLYTEVLKDKSQDKRLATRQPTKEADKP